MSLSLILGLSSVLSLVASTPGATGKLELTGQRTGAVSTLWDGLTQSAANLVNYNDSPPYDQTLSQNTWTMPATRCSGLSSSFLIKNGVPDRDGVLPTIQPCYQNDPAYAQYTSTPEDQIACQKRFTEDLQPQQYVATYISFSMDCTTGLLSAFLNYNNAYGYHTLAEHIYLLGGSLKFATTYGYNKDDPIYQYPYKARQEYVSMKFIPSDPVFFCGANTLTCDSNRVSTLCSPGFALTQGICCVPGQFNLNGACSPCTNPAAATCNSIGDLTCNAGYTLAPNLIAVPTCLIPCSTSTAICYHGDIQTPATCNYGFYFPPPGRYTLNKRCFPCTFMGHPACGNGVSTTCLAGYYTPDGIKCLSVPKTGLLSATAPMYNSSALVQGNSTADIYGSSFAPAPDDTSSNTTDTSSMDSVSNSTEPTLAFDDINSFDPIYAAPSQSQLSYSNSPVSTSSSATPSSPSSTSPGPLTPAPLPTLPTVVPSPASLVDSSPAIQTPASPIILVLPSGDPAISPASPVTAASFAAAPSLVSGSDNIVTTLDSAPIATNLDSSPIASSSLSPAPLPSSIVSSVSSPASVPSASTSATTTSVPSTISSAVYIPSTTAIPAKVSSSQKLLPLFTLSAIALVMQLVHLV